MNEAAPRVVDWTPMLRAILSDLEQGQEAGVVSAKFHNTLTEIIVTVARQIDQQRIVLTGGCFQNRYLIERSAQRLLDSGFRCYWHQRIPPNDGGISLGQVMSAARAYRPRQVQEMAETI